MSVLEQRQAAGAAVEKQLVDFMLQFHPTHELRVSDVLTIAGAALRIAFDAFDAAFSVIAPVGK